MVSRETVLMSLFTGQEWRQRRGNHLWTLGEGEGGTSGESGISIYAPARVGRRAGGKVLHDDPEGWTGGGGEAQEGNVCSCG